MIIAELRELGVDPSEIVMTDWQVSDKEDFSTIIAQSMNDKDNKTAIIFDNISVKIGKKYYGRARVFIKDMGWNTINNMDIFVREDGDDIVVENMLPTIIPAPKIMIQKDGKNLPLHEVPNLGIHVVLEPQSLVGDNHVDYYTFNYYIMDHLGHVIHKVEKTTSKSIKIEDGLLEPHKVYSIKCCCTDNIGESSPLGSAVINTIPALQDDMIANIIHGFVGRDYTKEVDIKVPFDLDVTYIHVDLILSRNGTNTILYSQVITKNDPYLRVPANTLTHGVFYNAKVKRNNTINVGSFQAL